MMLLHFYTFRKCLEFLFLAHMFQSSTLTSIAENTLTLSLVVCFAMTDINKHRKRFYFLNIEMYVFAIVSTKHERSTQSFLLKNINIEQRRHVNIDFNSSHFGDSSRLESVGITTMRMFFRSKELAKQCKFFHLNIKAAERIHFYFVSVFINCKRYMN